MLRCLLFGHSWRILSRAGSYRRWYCVRCRIEEEWREDGWRVVGSDRRRALLSILRRRDVAGRKGEMVEEEVKPEEVGGFEQAYQDEARDDQLKEKELQEQAHETLLDVQSGEKAP